MRYTVTVLIAALFLVDYTGILPGSGVPFLPSCLTYHFFHANIFHLLVNILAMWTILAPRRPHNARVFAIGYLIATAVYPLALRPVIGISNILYACIGQRTPSLRSKWWKSAPVITFLVVTLLMGLLPQVAGTTHIASFALGVAVAALQRRIDKLDNDIARASH